MLESLTCSNIQVKCEFVLLSADTPVGYNKFTVAQKQPLQVFLYYMKIKKDPSSMESAYHYCNLVLQKAWEQVVSFVFKNNPEIEEIKNPHLCLQEAFGLQSSSPAILKIHGDFSSYLLTLTRLLSSPTDCNAKTKK